MATIKTRPITAEEFCDFVHRPENAGRYFELDEGEMVELPSPMPPHGLICGNVTGILWNYTRQAGRGYVLSNDTGVILARDPDTVRGPDVMVYDDEKTYDEMLAERSYPEVPPLLAVEVLSPSDRIAQVTRKVNQYLHAGVKLVWVLDPVTRDAMAYRPDTEADVLGPEGTLDGRDVLPGLSVKVAELFRKPGEK